MEDYNNYNTYINILSFATFRGYTIKHNTIPENEYLRFKINNHITIECNELIIILMKKRQKTKSDQIIRDINSLTNKYNRAIIFVDELYKQSIINKININCEFYKYENFLINIIQHDIVPKARIITNEEFESRYPLIKINECKYIKEHDIMCIWLNAHVGQIIEIDNISEQCIISNDIRIVVK